jgi:predicted ATPase/DNA-binding XRE family transcriptional regulator
VSAPPLENLAGLIRRYRLQAGITQEELAGRSGLSVRAISDLERSLRTAPRMETLRMLASALELAPESRMSLFAAARPEYLAAAVPAPVEPFREKFPRLLESGRSALPIPPTRLVGRDRELSQLESLLESPDVRLVTLTGPGGVGKTRLALALAAAIAAQSSEDVAFVDLTPVTRPNNVAASIIESLSVSGPPNRPPVDVLCDALENHSLLLLLDNFEHLLDAAPEVSRLLEHCRNLRILVTSRERLQLRGEHVFSVSPLPLPDAGGPSSPTLSAVVASPAVRLFLDRAREAQLDLALDDRDAPAIAGICRRVDGLPLAIELAASWMRHESAAALLDRLERRLPALTGGPRDLPDRQQTLRSTVAWSYDLLPIEQQALFRALCIFPSGFTLEAAIAIAEQQASSISQWASSNSSTPGTLVSPFDTVIALIERSLIQESAGRDQAYRFRILELVREFGLELLAAHGEEHAARQFLLSWFESLAGNPELEALDGYLGIGRLSLTHEEDNLRAALAIAIEHGGLSSAVRVILMISPHWWEHGLFEEARSAVDRVIGRGDELDPSLLAIVLGWAAEWAWLQSDYARVRELAESALAMCRLVGNEAGAAANLYRLGRVATALEPLEARPFLEEALELNQRLGNDRDAAWTLVGLGYAAGMLNDLSDAESHVDRASAMIERLADPLRGGLAVSCKQARAWIALMHGDLDAAESLVEQTLTDSREQGYEFGECNALRLLGRIARQRGDLERAVTLQLEALRLAQKHGAVRRECYCLIELASLAQITGQSRRAVRLLGAEASLRRRLGHVYTLDELTTQSRTRDSLLKSIGNPAFEEAWQSSEELDWAARLEEASSVKDSFTR